MTIKNWHLSQILLIFLEYLTFKLNQTWWIPTTGHQSIAATNKNYQIHKVQDMDVEDLHIGGNNAPPVTDNTGSLEIEQSFKDKYSYLIKNFVADFDDSRTNDNSKNGKVNEREAQGKISKVLSRDRSKYFNN